MWYKLKSDSTNLLNGLNDIIIRAYNVLEISKILNTLMEKIPKSISDSMKSKKNFPIQHYFAK